MCDLEEGGVFVVDVVLRAMLGQPALAVRYEGRCYEESRRFVALCDI